MSKNYGRVKAWYDFGMWSKARVHAAVGKWITKDEYKQITGEAYEK